MTGVKYDEDKDDWSLMPLMVWRGPLRVLMFGEKKYARNNYQNVKPARRYWSALFRHAALFASGEHRDQESGMSHLWHMGACMFFILWFELYSGFVPDSLNEPAALQEPKQSDPQPTLQSLLEQCQGSAQPQSKAQDSRSTTSGASLSLRGVQSQTDLLEMIVEFDSAVQDWKIVYAEKPARARKTPAPASSRKARAASKPRQSRRKAR